MVRSARSIVLTSLLLATLACGLPVGKGASTSSPTEALLPTPTPEPLEPLSLLEAVTARTEAEGWTESQGLVHGLRFLVGELSADEAFGDTPLVNGEGTGIVRAAQIYLQDLSNVNDRAEIERLLAILVPSRATLERFSQPAVSMREVPGLASPVSRPRGDPTQCQALWASGFASPLPLVCLEFGEIAIDGRTYRVYFPAAWPVGGSRRALLQPALDALGDSVRLYNTYGSQPVMSADIIFTDLDILVPDPDTGGFLRDPDIYAAAEFPVDAEGAPAPDPEEASCRIGVFPAAVDQAAVEGGVAAFRQTLAHELFHCYQYTNLRPEEYASRLAGTQWWIEGSAEFFGSVVYPLSDDEFQYLPRFQRRSSRRSLLSLDYDAYPFFLYLARQAGLGPEGVIALLREMPEGSGGLEAEQQVLAGSPGIQEAFHRFGQAFLDRQLEDYGGGRLPLDPDEGAQAEFGIGEGEGFFPTEPFRLKHYRIHFDDDVRFRINQTIEGSGKVSARAASAVGAWGRVPSELNTACAETDYVLLVTAPVLPGTDPINLALATLGERVEEEIGCEECVLGTWQLDNASYLAHMGGVWPLLTAGISSFGLSTDGAVVYPTKVSGAMQITFKQDGMAEGVQSNWAIAGEASNDDGTVETEVVYNGAGQAAWRIQPNEATGEDYLFFEDGSFNLIFQMTFQRIPLASRPTGGSNDPLFLSSPQPFLCDATTLTYYADDPLGSVWFTRTTPPPGAP